MIGDLFWARRRSRSSGRITRVRAGRRRGGGCFESLESRKLLAVTASLVGEELDIFITQADPDTTAYVRLNGSDIEVATESSFMAPVATFPAAGVSSIRATGDLGSEFLTLVGGVVDSSLQVFEIEAVSFQNDASMTGDVVVESLSGDITVSGVVTGGAVNVNAAGDVTVSGALSAVLEVLVVAGGGISQTAGGASAAAVVSPYFYAEAQGGPIMLDSLDNAVVAFAAVASSPGAAVTFSNGSDVTVAAPDGITTDNGDIMLLADGTITIRGPLSYGTGAVSMQSLSGGEVNLVVTSGLDAGNGSLRAVLGYVASGVSPFPTVGFDPSVSIISLSSSLDAITNAVAIDGTGAVRIDGSAIAGPADGLVFMVGSDGSVISGLSITGFSGAGVRIEASGISVLRNRIGVDESGVAVPNEFGVVVSGSNATGVVIGAESAGNVISGNTSHGVVVENSGSATFIANLIGLDVIGVAALPNGGDGIHLDGSLAVSIGDSSASSPNVISGNAGAGVRVANGSTGTVLEGNWIGLTSSGDVGIGNGLSGIVIDGTGADARIGGDSAAAANVVSGNGRNGIEISGGSSANDIRRNLIGLDALGIAIIGNSLSGIAVTDASGSNVIGAIGSGNRIAGNGQHGIHLASGSFNTRIVGNQIGLDFSDLPGAGNKGHGVFVEGSADNLINGNVVSGNAGDGIHILGLTALGNSITGNLVGTSSTGTTAVGNGGVGIHVLGATGIVIGGGSPSDRNVVSGNESDGITVTADGLDGAANAFIVGNYVGVDVTGGVALGNRGDGIRVEGLGSDDANISSNLVSGNDSAGIRVSGGANAAGILSNIVGLDASGSTAVGNGQGIVIAGGVGHFIGGASTADSNVVSGNVGPGVVISEAEAAVISFNFVGTDPFGTFGIGNGSDGIHIDNAYETLVASNLISANGGAGISIKGVLTTGTSIVGTLIGTDAAGLVALGNGQGGISVADASLTAIGGSGPGNLISGNGGDGISLFNASGTSIQANLIGLSVSGLSAIGNAGSGISVSDSGDTTIDGFNRIAFNGGHGILVSSSVATSVGDAATGQAGGNEVFRNDRDGVRIEGASTATLVVGNFIGTNSTGILGLGNGGAGIGIYEALGATVGGVADDGNTEPMLGNVVVGNAVGIRIVDSVSPDVDSGNLVIGNTIRQNVGTGILVEGSAFQTIGGDRDTAGNVIVLNGGDGIRVANQLPGGSSDVGGHVLAGNFVGTDAAGSLRLGNRGDGIVLVSSVANTVGGAAASAGNLVMSNRHGISLLNSIAASLETGNVIAGNTIRTNRGDGIRLEGSDFNTIGESGGSGLGNSIWNSGGNGMQLLAGSDANVLGGNLVGIDADGRPLANGKNGIAIVNGADNQIIANTVANNSGSGIRFTGGSGNTIGSATAGLGNRISRNRGAGIQVGAMSGGSIEGNVIDQNGAAGLALVGASSISVSGENVVTRNAASGISISGGSRSNIVSGNLIGTDGSSNQSMGNAGGGVLVVSSFANVVENNSISHNRGDGVFIRASVASIAADGNRVAGNESRANSGNGIATAASSFVVIDGNLVGGKLSGDGNGGSGVVLGRQTSRASVVANTIVGNGVHGISLVGAGSNNIGGGVSSQMNVVERNLGDGINLTADSTNNSIQGNTLAANLGDGVEISGSLSNEVRGNILEANRGVGVLIVSSRAPTFAGGNAVAGNAVRGNGTGIAIDGSWGTTVGGDDSADANVVNLSVHDGLVVRNGSRSTLIRGNRIEGSGQDGIQITSSRTTLADSNTIRSSGGAGVRFSGASGSSISDGNVLVANEIESNAGPGVVLTASLFNTIGGTIGNSIDGNGSHGVLIESGSAGNVVVGNEVGLVDGNAGDGVRIVGSLGNELRGGNAIRNSGGVGVRIVNSFAETAAVGNRVLGNSIAANSLGGVLVRGGGVHQIGGTAAGESNEIGNNGVAGVAITMAPGTDRLPGAIVAGNSVQSNRGPGLLVTGGGRHVIRENAIAGNAGDGVALTGSAHNVMVGNVIGGTAPNVNGIALANAAAFNVISGNTISGNVFDGITIAGNRSSDNLIGERIAGFGDAGLPNTISSNGGVAVRIATGVRNQIGANAVFSNLGGGVVLMSGANSLQPSPTLLSAARVVSGSLVQLQVTGEVRGAPRQRIVVEFFRNAVGDGDPSTEFGYQARTPVGRAFVTTSTSGVATFSATINADVPAGEVITAIATTASLVTGNSSQISSQAVPVSVGTAFPSGPTVAPDPGLPSARPYTRW